MLGQHLDSLIQRLTNAQFQNPPEKHNETGRSFYRVEEDEWVMCLASIKQIKDVLLGVLPVGDWTQLNPPKPSKPDAELQMVKSPTSSTKNITTSKQILSKSNTPKSRRVRSSSVLES